MKISPTSNNFHLSLYDSLAQYNEMSENIEKESKKEGEDIQNDINSAQATITASSNILANANSSMFGNSVSVDVENIEALKTIGELDSVLLKSISSKDYAIVSKLTNAEDIVQHLQSNTKKLSINKDKIIDIKQKHADSLQGLTQAQSVHSQEAHMKIMEIKRIIDIQAQLLQRYIRTLKQVASSAVTA